MLIATWNVNSIRTRLDHVKSWLKAIKPDVLCIQETKVDNPLFPKNEFEDIGYEVRFFGQKAYNGVAIISKLPIDDVRTGFCGELKDDSETDIFEAQKRIISALINNIRIINVYVPNGSALGTEKYHYKLKWLKYLKRYIDLIENRGEPICLLGDFNIALESKDIHSPERLTGGIMASELERSELKGIINNRLQDVFRLFEQDTNHWSWWDYRSGAWDRDKGWRIDHIYLSEELVENTKSCLIDKNTRGLIKPSDHAPVLVDINWPPLEEESSEIEFLEY